jgi:hypothetical protein
MTKKTYLYLLALTAALTYTLYRYHATQPPDQDQIERCNAMADAMPENTEQEINQSINTFLECLQD